MIIFTAQYYVALALAAVTALIIILAGLPLQIFAVPLVVIVFYLLWLESQVTRLHQERLGELLGGMQATGETVRFTALGGMSETTVDRASLLRTLAAHREPSLWFGLPVTSTVQGDPVSLHLLTSGETTILNFRRQDVSYRVMIVTDDLKSIEDVLNLA